MKVVIELDMNNESDAMRHKLFMHADDMASALFDIQNNLARRVEWSSEGQPHSKLWDLFLDEIGKILEDNNIDMDKIYH